MEESWREVSSLKPIIIRQVGDLPSKKRQLLKVGTGRALDLDFHLEGAPNWRAPREESLNVYGVAQPTLPGLKGILSVLGCRPPIAQQQNQSKSRISTVGVALDTRRVSMDDKRTGWQDSRQEDAPQGRCVWFCTREEPISESPH